MHKLLASGGAGLQAGKEMSVGIMLYSLSGSTSSKSDKNLGSITLSLSAAVIALLHLLSVLL
jgi:hypothetical protein